MGLVIAIFVWTLFFWGIYKDIKDNPPGGFMPF